MNINEYAKNWNAIILGSLLLAGGVLRIASCFWGYPYAFHPDENLVVTYSIDMISNHTYLAEAFVWPDQFAIKLCAIFFQIYSYAVYHVSAASAFVDHRVDFYIIARMVTAIFGVLIIFYSYKSMEIICRKLKLVTAGLMAFFPLLVQHSAYATPDIILSFFVLFTAYISLLYLEDPKLKYLVLMSVSAGFGITVKFPGTFICFYIALVIIIESIFRKKYFEIITRGILAIIIVFATCLMVAPNLFGNFFIMSEVLNRNSGSFLNLNDSSFFKYLYLYGKAFLDNAGYEALLFLIGGLFASIFSREKKFIFFFMGLIFMVCMCSYQAYYVRYALPFFVFFILLIVVGMKYFYSKSNIRIMKFSISILSLILLLNCLFSGLLAVQSALTPEARVHAMAFCEENGITRENTLYDSYSPFELNGPRRIAIVLDKNNNLIIPDGIEYIIISSLLYHRYKWGLIHKIYQKIQENDLIYDEGGSFYGYNNFNNSSENIDHSYYRHSNFAIINIYYAIKGLLSHNSDSVVGSRIKIYRVKHE